MKRKRQFTNRILSLVLAVVMVLAMLPAMNMTAYAATEVECLGKNTHTPYTDGLTHYFTYDNYLYRATFTNLKATGRTVSIGNFSGQLYLSLLREGGGNSLDLLKDQRYDSTQET